MRIISGKYKIRTLPSPKRFKARPTTDFARENLLNVLKNNYIMDGATALDLFAGTGSISFELASNGCKKVIAVEKDGRHLAFIKSIVERLNISEIELLHRDAFKFLEKTAQSYDIIFADPPFQLKGIEKIPELIFERNLLDKNGVLIMEHSREHDFSHHPNYTQKKMYGSVNFSFFQPL